MSDSKGYHIDPTPPRPINWGENTTAEGVTTQFVTIPKEIRIIELVKYCCLDCHGLFILDQNTIRDVL